MFSIVGAALTDFAPLLLHLRIHSTLDDRLMDVLEHHPILTVIVDSLLILVGFGISFEIENAVLLPAADLSIAITALRAQRPTTAPLS